MATSQRDVKLVFGGGGGSGDITATPPGSSLNGILQSGFPGFQGVAQPTVDLFLDFNDGTDVDTLGINLAGSTTNSNVVTFNNTKIYRKHEWIPTGGFDGGGFMRMHWFTGMGIGFSPVWIQVPGGYTPHYLLNYQVRQSANMLHEGSSVKLLRQISHDFKYEMGTMEWTNSSVGAGQFQRLKWFFDGFAQNIPGPAANTSRTLCVWDDIADPGAGCVPKHDGLIDGNFHDFSIECDYRDPEASIITIFVDGVGPYVVNLPPESAATGTTPFIPNVGTTYYVSPFAEMYSCGPSGCGANINTGDYDVDHFSYTILP